MEVLQNRVASFSKHKRGKSLKWPHPKTWQATPDTLAEAGFYFDPSTDDPDNVTCFMCGKQVTEWAEDDDPFDIHWQKCAQMCAWASVRCGLRRDTDSRGRFVFPDKSRLPTSKAMEKARLQTFAAHGWKHDKNKKHMATSKKMAHAGFIFTPVEAGDDTGTCMFCNVALGNWDEDDDPMQHHLDRNKSSNPCPFLALAFGAALEPPSKSQVKQPKTTKRTAKDKPPSHTEVLFPTKTYDGSDDEAAVPFPGTNAKTPRKVASASTSKTPRTVTRSLSRANLKVQDGDEEDDAELRPKKRGRSKSVSRRKVPQDDHSDDRSVSPAPSRQRSTAAARSRTKSTSRPAPALDPAKLFDDDDEPQPKVARKPSQSKSKAQAEDSSKVEQPVVRKPSRAKSTVRELEVAVDGEQLGEEPITRKSSRSKPKPKASEDEKEKSKRPPSRSQVKSQPPEEEDTSSDGWFVAPVPPPPATARSRTKSAALPRGKNQARDVDEAPVVSRKERKQQDPADELDILKLPSRSRTAALEAVDHPPPVHKRSRTVSKTLEAQSDERKLTSRAKSKALPAEDGSEDEEVKEQPQLPDNPRSKPSSKVGVSRPPSRTKANSAPQPLDDEPDGELEMEMEQYLPQPPAKARSKPASRAPSRTKVNPPHTVEVGETEQYLRQPSGKSRPKPASKVDGSRPSSRAKTNMSADGKLEEDVETDVEMASTVKSKSKPLGPSSQAKAIAPPFVEDELNGEAETDMERYLPQPPVAKTRSKPSSKFGGSGSSSRTKTNPPPSDKRNLDTEIASLAKPGQQPLSEEDGLLVVDISTDDEAPPPSGSKRKGEKKELGKGKKLSSAGRQQKRASVPGPEVHVLHASMDRDDDVEMAEVEESMQQLEAEPDVPVTPPRVHHVPVVAAGPSDRHDAPDGPTDGFSFIPPLATDPFTNIDSLSEAEQEMTVEEWIRYQMGLEYERFKRDGERQLGLFESRAEEVRRAIETL